MARSGLLVASGLLLAGGLAVAPPARAAEREARPLLVVEVRLTATRDLPPEVTAELAAEATSIWRRAGVELRWRSDPPRPADASLRVLVMERAAPGRPGAHSWAVGELLEDRTGAAFAVVSIAAARRVVASASRLHDPQTLVDRRLAVVLGRAVAHEVGHFLQGSGAHARRGLMRARVDVADFADLRRGGFDLDREAAIWLRDAVVRLGTRGAPATTAVARLNPPRR